MGGLYAMSSTESSILMPSLERSRGSAPSPGGPFEPRGRHCSGQRAHHRSSGARARVNRNWTEEAAVRPQTSWRCFGMSVLASVLAGAFIPLSPAAAKVLGTCKFDGQDNPGLGCKSTSEGKACTINGKDGTCASVPFPTTSLKGCVCQVDGKMPEEAEAKAQA